MKDFSGLGLMPGFVGESLSINEGHIKLKFVQEVSRVKIVYWAFFMRHLGGMSTGFE